MKGPEAALSSGVPEQEKPETNPVIVDMTIAKLRAEALGGLTPVDGLSSSISEKPKDPAVEAIDEEIKALKAKRQEGRKLVAKMTDKRMIDIAEKNEDAIGAKIAELESKRQVLLGKKPS